MINNSLDCAKTNPRYKTAFVLKELAAVETGRFTENVKNVSAVDDCVCVGDILLRDISLLLLLNVQ